MALIIGGGRRGSGGGGRTTAVVIEIFNPDKEGGYKQGTLIYYDEQAYIFTSDHEGEWTGDDVVEVAIVASRPVKWIMTLEFDDTTTGLLRLLNSDIGSVVSGGINPTTGLVDVTVETE